MIENQFPFCLRNSNGRA